MVSATVMAEQKPDTEIITVNKIRLGIDQSKQTIESVMAMDAFKTNEKRMDWRFKFNPDEEDDVDETNELWGKLLLLIARGVEYSLWLIPVILVFFLIYYRQYWLGLLASSTSSKDKPAGLPDIMFGIELSPDALPDNIPESALNLWQHGEEREALSLLFRASLIKIFTDRKIAVTRGLTEHECIKLVNNSVDHGRARYFELIAKLWIKMAYGHVKPEQAEFNQLCVSWGDYFNDGVPQ